MAAGVYFCPICDRLLPPGDAVEQGWLVLINETGLIYFDRIRCLRVWTGDEIAKEIRAQGT